MNTTARKFESFSDAMSACGGAYEDTVLTEVVAEKTKRLVQLLDSNPVQLDHETAQRLALIHSCIPSVQATVIDVGGACGYYFHLYNRTFRATRLKSWRVVETTSMVAAAKERRFDNGILSFSNQLAGSVRITADVPDLVLLSSSLQYFSSPAETLGTLISLGPKSIIITRTPFSSSPERLISVQKSRLRDNGPGPLPEQINDDEVRYPVVFESLELIKDILERGPYIVDVIKESGATLFFDGQGINSHYTLIARRSS